jgi:hypothetical protein
MKAVDRIFSTNAADHANCSVGSYTHGFITLDEAAARDDVAAALESGWVDEAAVSSLPHVVDRPARVVYGPLAKFVTDPDVVLVRINALALMTLKDAFPRLRIEGKPQCHIIAIAKEDSEIAVSVGCGLSRARTGMRSDRVDLRAAGIAACRDRTGHRSSFEPRPCNGELCGHRRAALQRQIIKLKLNLLVPTTTSGPSLGDDWTVFSSTARTPNGGTALSTKRRWAPHRPPFRALRSVRQIAASL